MFDSGELHDQGSGGVAVLTDDQLEAELTEISAHIAAAQARALELTAELDKRGSWAGQGCTSAAHWLGWRTGLSPGAARDHVALARKLEELPRVKDAFSKGKVSYFQARALARAATPATEKKLVEWASLTSAGNLMKVLSTYTKVRPLEQCSDDEIQRRRYLNCYFDDTGDFVMSGRMPADEGALVVKGLDAARDNLWEKQDEDAGDSRPDPYGPPQAPRPDSVDALVALSESFMTTGLGLRSPSDRFQVVVHVDADVLSGAGTGSCHIQGLGPLPAETAQRLVCDSSVVAMLEKDGEVVGSTKKTKSIPVHLRRELAAKEKCCSFPGCTRTANLEAHHIVYRSRGGKHELINLTWRCPFHHRLEHEGGYTTTRDNDGTTRFFYPSGLEIKPAPDLVATGPPLEERNEARGLSIDAQTPRGQWDGKPVNRELAVGSLLDMDARAELYPENFTNEKGLEGESRAGPDP